MTATDELRRLLDERGVEWREHTELQGEITLWNGWQFFEGMASYNDGYSMLSMVDATPAQAVEATLGSDLEAENAKLRELVRDMYEDIVCSCAECFSPKYSEHRGKPSECGNGGCYRQIADRMRELGVDA